MKKCLLIVSFLMILGIEGMAQEKNEAVYELKTTVISEVTNNFRGGISRGANFNGHASVALGVDLQKANLWKGGYFYAQGFAAYGDTPSSSQIGDIQPISRIETTTRITLFEFWYSQKIGKKAEILIGQHNMNASFAANSITGEFINTSFGIFPSVGLQTPLSIYPAPVSGGKVKVALTDQLVIQGALYDGKPLAHEDNPHNLKRDWQLFDKLFSISEIAYSPKTEKTEKSAYKLGAFYHSGGGVSIVDGLTAETCLGLYTTVEQSLLSIGKRHIASYLQAGYSTGNQNLADAYFSTGVSLKGLNPAWSDVLSLGLAYSSINDKLVEQQLQNLTSYRALLELTYKAKINENFSLQPDLQYIINPGASQQMNNVFAGIIRFTINY